MNYRLAADIDRLLAMTRKYSCFPEKKGQSSCRLVLVTKKTRGFFVPYMLKTPSINHCVASCNNPRARL